MSIVPGEIYKGKISYFGGPTDLGVTETEGLALYNNYEDNETLFLNYQPKGTTGLARRLNPDRFYLAMRWGYDLTPKQILKTALVKITFQDKIVFAAPADWGPNIKTGRLVDVSPGVMKKLRCQTDDEVECVLIL